MIRHGAGMQVPELIAPLESVSGKGIIRLATSDLDLAEGLVQYGVDANDRVDAETVAL